MSRKNWQYGTVDELLAALSAEIGTMPVSYARKQLTIEDMRNKVGNLLAHNIWYVENGMKVDVKKSGEIAGGKQFIEKQELVFREKDGMFSVGSRINAKWLTVKNGQNAIVVPRKFLLHALKGIGAVVQSGGLDETILAIRDDLRKKAAAARARKNAQRVAA